MRAVLKTPSVFGCAESTSPARSGGGTVRVVPKWDCRGEFPYTGDVIE